MTDRFTTLGRRLISFSPFNNGAKQDATEDRNVRGSQQNTKESPKDLVDGLEELVPWDFVDGVEPSRSPDEQVRNWLKYVPLKMQELSFLRREDRRLIAKQRPSSRYDLLPHSVKNETYFVQFDMETAKARFIVRHRSATCTCDALPQDDKVHLLQVAKEFVQKSGFVDAALVVPLGDQSQVGVVYSTFYAYIVVRDTEKFLSLFRKASAEHKILSWPHIKKWKSVFWLADVAGYQSINIYIESVRNNTSTYPPKEFFLMSTRSLPSASIERGAPQGNLMDILSADFKLQSWPEQRIVGVKSGTIARSNNWLNAWQYLQHMAQLSQDWKKKEADVPCWISLTLASHFHFFDGSCWPAFILFPFGVPQFLQNKIEAEQPNRRPSRKASALGKRGGNKFGC